MKRYFTVFLVLFSMVFAAAQTHLTQAEFFWDIDPGEGNATAIDAVDGNLNTAVELFFKNNLNLPTPGFHSFCIRIKDNNGHWSPIFKNTIKIDFQETNFLVSLSQAECFWDADPGEGNGIPLLGFDGNFDSNIEQFIATQIPIAQPIGFHLFSVRLKDSKGIWGPVFKNPILIEATVCDTPQPIAMPQKFCGSATVLDLLASGSNVLWYENAIGGSPLSSSTLLQSKTYYASQTIDNCESNLRTAVLAQINAMPDLSSISNVTVCGNFVIPNIQNVQFFTGVDATGFVLPQGSIINNSQTIFAYAQFENCIAQSSFVVIINPIPQAPIAVNQTFCEVATVANLEATGSNLKWYSSPSNSLPLPPSTVLGTGAYYVTQFSDFCESEKTMVLVDFVMPPTVFDQEICEGEKIADLIANGINLNWYATPDSTVALPLSTVVSTGLLYVSQTVNNCESYRKTVSVHAVICNTECWKIVVAGGGHSVAIKTDGSLWAWGDNSKGQLGNGSNISKTTPTKIGTATNWKAIAAGSTHNMALKSDGSLWMWGENTNGQLGIGTTINKNIPVRVGLSTNWSQIAAGGQHSMAIKTDGTLWAWGSNFFSALGDGTDIDRYSPFQIGTDTTWTSIATAELHSIGIQSGNSFDYLLAWGHESYGELGYGTASINEHKPKIISSDNWKYVAVGKYHSMAIHDNGKLYACGLNSSGQLGNGTTTNVNVMTQIGTATNWEKVWCGFNNSFALKTNNTLWTWGNNSLGQLGIGNTTNKTTPFQIAGTRWRSISPGQEGHVLANKIENTLFVCGNNSTGQLGNASLINSNSLTAINCYDSCSAASPGATAVQVFCAGATVANLVATGTLLKWYDIAIGGNALATTKLLTNGTYYVSQTIGCESFRTSILVLIGNENIDTTLAENNNVLTANFSNASYQWLQCENGYTAIAGANAQSFSPTQNGSYAVAITVSNCEALISNCFTISNLNTDYFDLNTQSIVYPNPSFGAFSVSTANKIVDKIVIFDGLGREIITSKPNKTISLFDLKPFADGVYYISIFDENRSITKKLILTKK